MRINLLLFVLLATMVSSCTSQQDANDFSDVPVLWNLENLDAKVASIAAGAHYDAYDSLKAEADSYLNVKNPTVMTKPMIPASGDMHDYMSLARYWWPNPDTEDGLPYVCHDGEVNPEIDLYDRRGLGDLADYVETMSLVYYISGEQKYADKVISLLRTWFVDPETRMNPNLNYSQVYKGHYDGKGNSSGLIDGYQFMHMLDCAALLDRRGVMPKDVEEALQAWFASLAEWYQTSDNGIKGGKAANNHSIAYDAQIIRYLIYCGDIAQAKEWIAGFRERRIKTQIAADGSQPEELKRTLAYHYMEYNLDHIIDICSMAHAIGVDLYGENKAEIDSAFSYMIPYTESPETFPYQQIRYWDGARKAFSRLLYRTSYLGHEQEYRELYSHFTEKEDWCDFDIIYIKD